MKKTFRFECRIVDENGDMVIVGDTTFDYDNVKITGDCEEVDNEVGRAMRRLIKRVETDEEHEEEEREVVGELAKLAF